MPSGDVYLGDRGDELIRLLYRFGGLTVKQYAALCPDKDEQAQITGATSTGNKYGRRLSSRVTDIRRWIEQDRDDEEIARLLGVAEPEDVAAFIAKRGLREVPA